MDLISGLRYAAAEEGREKPGAGGVPAAFSLDGRTAVVTGAASGIGRATAAVYAAAGARLVVADIRSEPLDEVASGLEGSVAVPTDVSDRRSVDDLARAALRATGRVDVWANVAGVIRTGPILDTTEEDFDAVEAVNLRGVFWGVATAGKVMSAAKRGSIINMASSGGEVPVPDRSVYGMTKAAVIHLTRTAAAEFGPLGIRVNAVAPGFIETRMTSRAWTRPDGSIDEEARRGYLGVLQERSPLHLTGEPEDVAWAMLYLAADASRFMTGEVLRPNGGVHMA